MNPDGSSAQWTRAGGSVLFTNEVGRTTETQTDGRGNAARIVEGVGLTNQSAVTLTHDAFGNLTRTRDDDGAENSWVFDSLGLLRETYGHSSGHSVRDYDLDGLLAFSRDALGTKLEYKYDFARRLETIRHSSGAEDAYFYDVDPRTGAENGWSKGRLTGTRSCTGEEEYFGYDVVGRRSEVTRCPLPGRCGSVWREFNRAGELAVENYSDGDSVSYQYDLDGLLERIPGNVESITRNARGLVTEIVHQDYTKQTWSYHPTRGWPIGTQVTRPSQPPRFSESMSRNALGEPTSDDTSDVFGYGHRAWGVDELGRLAEVVGTGFPQEAYTYSPSGNINWSAALGNYNYDPQTHRAIEAGRNITCQYDSTGQMISNTRDSYTWSEHQRLASKRGGADVNFGYYASGELAWKMVAGGWPTLFFDNDYFEADGIAGKWVRVDRAVAGQRVDGKVRSISLDLLEAPIHEYSATWGEKAARWSAYGNLAQGQAIGEFGYSPTSGASFSLGPSGQMRDNDSSLARLGDRWVQPEMARFLSSDPESRLDLGAQGLNRYSYAANRPHVLKDPTGRFPVVLTDRYDRWLLINLALNMAAFDPQYGVAVRVMLNSPSYALVVRYVPTLPFWQIPTGGVTNSSWARSEILLSSLIKDSQLFTTTMHEVGHAAVSFMADGRRLTDELRREESNNSETYEEVDSQTGIAERRMEGGNWLGKFSLSLSFGRDGERLLVERPLTKHHMGSRFDVCGNAQQCRFDVNSPNNERWMDTLSNPDRLFGFTPVGPGNSGLSAGLDVSSLLFKTTALGPYSPIALPPAPASLPPLPSYLFPRLLRHP